MKINKLKKKNYLTSRGKKYCRCLIHVRSKKIRSPYAICTNSVFNLQNKKRSSKTKCGKNYNFKNFSVSELRLYAQEKNIKIKKKNIFLTKKKIIEKLKKKYRD
tara:strand:+ start:25 stop:336 length:312 start_codon:yes stop_codon:yes gene_type:complete